MKTFSVLAFILMTLSATVSMAQDKPAPTEVDGKIDWVFDLAQGQKLSEETGKPVFIVFRCER